MNIDEYLATILDALREQLKSTWAAEQDANRREQAWHQLQAVELIAGKIRAKLQAEEFES